MHTDQQGKRLLFAPGPRVTVEEYDVPAPGAGQILVRVTRSQVSAGSEMNFVRHGAAAYGLQPSPDARDRYAIGYMTVGWVEAIGSAVTGFAVGERVLTGGPHASHWLVQPGTPSGHIAHIPDNISDDVAGFAILGDVALHGVRRAALQIEQSVAVFGMGVVGQLTLQLARLSGAYPLIAVDLFDLRLEKAIESGATHTINAARENASQVIRDITGGTGADVIFHCTPAAHIMQSLLEACAERGTIVLTGSAPGTAQIRLQEELLRRELTIFGSYETRMDQPHPYWPWTRERNRRACLRLMSAGQLRIDHLITHVVAFLDAQSAFEMMARGGDDWLGVVLQWD